MEKETEEKLDRDMMLIKAALDNVPKFELVKLIMFIYFAKTPSLNDLINVRQATLQKIGDVIKKYIVQ